MECGHNADRAVRRTHSDGSAHLYVQCQVCGRGNPIPKSKASSVAPSYEDIPEFDEGLRDRWWREKREFDLGVLKMLQGSLLEREERERIINDNGYLAYLQTPEWASRRDKTLRRDMQVCQACLEALATEVHHRTYERIFNEPIFDLVSVCSDCHRKIHGK